LEGVAGRREGRSQIRFADDHTPMTPLRTIHRHILHLLALEAWRLARPDPREWALTNRVPAAPDWFQF
jgi:hypothetical protein